MNKGWIGERDRFWGSIVCHRKTDKRAKEAPAAAMIQGYRKVGRTKFKLTRVNAARIKIKTGSRISIIGAIVTETLPHSWCSQVKYSQSKLRSVPNVPLPGNC